jgi:hypothetical protein
MTIAQLTKRVAELEAKVKLLQEQTRPVDPSSSTHWLATAGKFKDDPLFEEAVKLGRQYRDSLRPGTKKKKVQKKPARRLAG